MTLRFALPWILGGIAGGCFNDDGEHGGDGGGETSGRADEAGSTAAEAGASTMTGASGLSASGEGTGSSGSGGSGEAGESSESGSSASTATAGESSDEGATGAVTVTSSESSDGGETGVGESSDASTSSDATSGVSAGSDTDSTTTTASSTTDASTSNGTTTDPTTTGSSESSKSSGGECPSCSFDNAEALCMDGECSMGECDQGYMDCVGGPANGCETYVLQGDPDHCGDCITACGYPNAAALCVGGGCQMGACELGWDDCEDGDVDGCETNVLGDDEAHCGACGSPCVMAQECSTGDCTEIETTCLDPGVMCAQAGCYEVDRYSVTPEIVVDRLYGRRLWLRNIVAADTHGSANIYCNNLILQGLGDWRLPTLSELADLLFHPGGLQGCGTCNPAIDQAAFPGVPESSEIWTSTAYQDLWETVNFCDGRSNYPAGYTDQRPFFCTHDPI